MSLVQHAEKELRLAGFFDPDSDFDGEIGPCVLGMIKAFTDGGHSGGSASITIHLFSKLAAYEPLTPLTGADDEWSEVESGIWQNKRCSHVFKTAKDGAYDIDGLVFKHSDGTYTTNANSRTVVIFPYIPKRVYVDATDGDP